MKYFLSLAILLFSLCNLLGQCNAFFSWDDTDITIQFMDESTTLPGDPIISWFWDFDDNGNTSNLQNPTYTFSDPDKYDVVLTITTQNGCTSTIEIEIETCVLNVTYTIGDCDANGNIPVGITITDPWDSADEVDVILDGQSVPGSPFNISDTNPVSLTVSVPGNGLDHVIQCQSTDIATCGKTIEFSVPDCSSDCFLSSLQFGYPIGSTHTVNVGDDFFSPVSTGMVLGDIVHFNWIGDGHSTTSDATTGVDAWNSGVISVGSTFDVAIDNPGVHPYYCIPHGGPGGSGMSGEILANCPTGNSLDLEISFSTSIANGAGYNVYYDAVLVTGSPFSYNGIGTQTITISIVGDGLSHPLLIEDVADPSCTLTTDYNAPDCGQGGGDPVCTISVSLGAPSGCDANQNVTVIANVSVANGGSGFNLSIDGGASTFYTYSGPNTNVTLTLPGDGMNHTISVVDDTDSACSAINQITTPNCNLPCSIINLVATAGGAGGNGITHTVNVQDFIFNPSVVNITVGDQVEWIWTGNVAHTSTSDVTSGSDSWDSGLLDNGASYLSPVLSEGEHLYYCVPHGNPGGEGMAGSIFVLPPCNANGEVMVTVTFDVTSNGTSGYEVLVDGIVAGTFSYVAGSAQSASVNVLGDNMAHTILVRDLDDVTCSATTNITTPDCNGGGNPTCMIDVTATISGACDANSQVPVDLTINASDQGSQFSVMVDGAMQGFFAYTGSTTNITINVDGDGQDHTIVITDNVDGACTSSTIVNTPNCALPCSISNLVATPLAGSGTGTTHTVNVEDFIFNPSIVNVTVGDQVEWIWTGEVAHTSTSDVSSGPDSWDSGLLDNGANYLSPVLTEGEHLYYCVPHGNPGGEGMAGTIFVLPPCNADGEVIINLTFDVTSNGANGYEVLVDGVVSGTFSYIGGSAQNATVNVLGDGMPHTILVRDIDDPTCNATTNITTADCNGGGNPECMIDLTASVGGGCDANDQVPVDLTITASDQGTNFSVMVDGANQGTFSYTGSTTNVTIDVDGDGQDHTIVVTDNIDGACSAITTINTPNCILPCSISNLIASPTGGGGTGTVHTVNVEDYIFNPSILNITTGDQVEWIWTGDIAHTSTSDASSGPDSWESGLLNNGDSFISPVLSEGEHPYYCIPHGNPGGVGMAGSVFVLPPCNDDGEVLVAISFDVSSNGASGFEVLVDGLVAGTFFYSGGSTQNVYVNVLGDNMVHNILVRDIDDNSCSATTTITTADCNGGGNPICMIDVEASINGGCDTNDQVPVDLTVTASDQGTQFLVFVDDVNQGSFSYTGSTTNLTIQIDGDGMAHSITVEDETNLNCSASTNITTTNCFASCAIDNISLSFLENATHVIQVDDFDFIPSDLVINIGDTIVFDWVGVIPHTATSDATSGTNTFDSGLLSQGATYQLVLNSLGDHPYYCIPHGASGGIGMAGNINVQAACSGDNANGTLSFTYEGDSGTGFIVSVDGVEVDESPIAYNPSGSISTSVSILGDNMEHNLVIADLGDSNCSNALTFSSPDCLNVLCNVALELSAISACDNANVVVALEVNSSIEDAGINFYKNGILLNDSLLMTDSQGNIYYESITVGNGMSAEFSVEFPQYPECNDTLLVDLPDCNLPCLLTDFEAGYTAKHTVEVRDFDFFPSDINVLIGDTVLFVWTGEVLHTSTSDATSGQDSWESGLLGLGDSFEIIINSEGEHPYYCIPHGGPGGIGMAGNITAVDTCNMEEWNTHYSFSVTAGSPLGYNLFLDGELLNSSPIAYTDPAGYNQSIVSVPGDGELHFLTIQDVETDFCAFTSSFVTGQCGADCTIENLEASVGSSVIHEIEVRDFDFLPSEVIVRAGETIRFIWIGEIPHTTTSDAVNGMDIWDSGLLMQGDTFDIVLNTIGNHPFYCIPHGGPGGIGQSGVIQVLPQCQEGEEEIRVTFEADGGSDDGYKLFVDGILIGTGLNTYQDSDGENTISFLHPADGIQHIVTVQDADNPICAASTFYNAQDCITDCEIDDLSYALIKDRDTVLVRDFDFFPIDITIEAGDTLFFDWTGDVPHTVTSDAIDGETVFNSGLLQQGDNYALVIDEVGEHPYYCIPHGGPGGIGMAGNIIVVEPCEDMEVLANVSFSTNKMVGTYNAFLNNELIIQGKAYSGQIQNQFNANLLADQTTIEITVIDQIDNTCFAILTEGGLNCADPCFGTVSEFEFDINFATMEVAFADISTGDISSWSWDFGDGGTSTLQNPTHTFADPIVYEVCLTIVQDDGCTNIFCDKVRFSDDACIAAFSYEQNDLEFTFFNTSDYEDLGTEILWTFGDGDISFESETVSHIYGLGVFTVCIQISSDSCEASYCEEIDLSDPCLLITPDFDIEKDGDGLTVTFTDETSGSPDKWLWGFGDGETSTEQNPIHSYEEMGIYNICLFVQETNNGCSKSFCKTINVGTTSVDEVHTFAPLTLYPNPSKNGNLIKVEGFKQGDIGSSAAIEIIDVQGKIVHSYHDLIGSTIILDFEIYPGVYYLSIKGKNKSYRALFMKI